MDHARLLQRLTDDAAMRVALGGASPGKRLDQCMLELGRRSLDITDEIETIRYVVPVERHAVARCLGRSELSEPTFDPIESAVEADGLVAMDAASDEDHGSLGVPRATGDRVERIGIESEATIVEVTLLEHFGLHG